MTNVASGPPDESKELRLALVVCMYRVDPIQSALGFNHTLVTNIWFVHCTLHCLAYCILYIEHRTRTARWRGRGTSSSNESVLNWNFHRADKWRDWQSLSGALSPFELR